MFKALLLKECRLLLRDPYALAVLFVMPVVFVLIMALSLQTAFSDKSSGQKQVDQLGIVLLADPDIPKDWQAVFAHLENFSVTVLAETANHRTLAEKQVLTGEKMAMVTLPKALIDALSKGQKIETPLSLAFAPTAPPAMRALLKASLMRILVEKKIAVTFQRTSPVAAASDSVPESNLSAFLGKSVITESTLGQTSVTTTPSSVQQSVPAWLVFAMFFIVIPLSATLLIEISQGTLARLHTYPFHSGWLLLGKLLPFMGVNLIQAALMFATGLWLVPLLGGESLTLGQQAIWLVPVALSVSLTAIALALLISVLARTHEQATTLGGVLNLLMGAVGGVMVPTFVMPETMQTLAAFSPMNWGLEAFLSVTLRQGGWAEIWHWLAQLVGFALVLLGVASWRLHKRLLGE
ncbi:MAG: ABC transporter permease [Hydrogenovibrio sp.]|uniref:ABC transporter permease n=1 Tax=Hydrogenovibrio sp. TaxID=2065821 RepID=UPI0028708191|nr:ABC transporter permease [Hydrogenovibrio sp.]MDR9499840.1 ABC transporter permease [Hydrogenovibrio sp.]